MLKKALVVVAVLLVVFVVVVAMQPSEFVISRSMTMDAPAKVAFDEVNNFHHWNAWSPWAKLDPNAKNTFDGPAFGRGAMFSWAGNDKVGRGKMTITESNPPSDVHITLDFEKPYKNTAQAVFLFKPEGKQTTVTWSMSGKSGFMAKAVCLFMNMDKMLGAEFEKGLTAMKAVVETHGKKSH